jgi:PAS domain S-box-containing protein
MADQAEHKRTIRLLHVDDQLDFAEMTTAFLERESDRLVTETVSSASEGLNRLAESTFDCVISDYEMPGQNGVEFLRAVREEWPDLPFILFTGKGSETVASDAISAGVTDYLQKSSGTEQYELLANRILNAVGKVWAERQIRTEQKRSEALFNRLSQPAVEVRYKNDEPIVRQANPAFEDVFGYESETMIDDSLDTHIVPDDRTGEATEINEYVQSGGSLESREVIRQTTDGLRTFLLQSAAYDDGSGGFAIYTDITDRRGREEAVERNRDLLRHTQQLTKVGGWEIDIKADELRWTEGVYDIYDLNPAEESKPTVEMGIKSYHPDDQEAIEAALNRCRTHGEAYELDLRLITAEDEQKWVRTTGEPVYSGDDIVKIRGAICDITQERERRQELEQIEALFQNTQDHLFLINVGEPFTIERLNPAWEDTPGISVEESRGQAIQDVLGEEEAQKVKQRYRKCVERREELEYEERVQFGDEEIEWETRLAPIVVDGEVEYIAGVSRDITHNKQRRQRLSELKQQYQTLVENFPDGAVYLIDENFEYIRARGEELERVGLSPTDIEGHTPHEVFPDELADEVCKQYEQAFNGNTTAVELEYRDERYRVRATPVGVDEDEIGYVMAVAQNITEHVENKQRLARQNEQLGEFVSVVSHDLRSPLSVAEGNLELLQAEYDSDRIEAIESALTRMDDLIEDLLQLARTGEQVSDAEPVDLAELFQTCWQNIETNDATIQIDIDGIIQADRGRLAQVLENLLRNAIEHTEQTVTVTVGELEDGLYIADDGDGIPEDERDDVFEAGYTTSDDGTGFGLSIVSDIVEAHGWEIQLTESAEGGAQFEITGAEFDSE